MKHLFALLAGYNRWANDRLYAAAAALPDAEYRAVHGAPQASVHGRLSHVLVADRVWMHRFTGDGPVHQSFDELPFETLAALTSARREEDDRIVAWIEGLDKERFGELVTYRLISATDDLTQPLAPLLTHMFMHQTHHRGQAHGLLTAIAGDKAAPAIDLIYFQRQTGVETA